MVVKNFLQIIQMTMILAMQVKTLCVVMPVYIYTFIIDRYSDCYDEYKPQSYYPPNYEIALLQGMYFLYKINVSILGTYHFTHQLVSAMSLFVLAAH